ncbi:Ephrin type-A receptor 5 [Holothuria leucospilota]|uniref:Ephrin type-A receptor 5 n=1 Tax=Holothuria leucospilota TaxID=206669 RepID=A0A9Q1CSL9_HOLLE|nr:Ephrin type-A receptor 5 [Holothuria leucospilota]
MGVIRCSKASEKNVVLCTKTDSPLYADGIHWPEYVKKVTELKENPFVVKVEGICVISANLYLVQEYIPMATLDRILSNQLFNKEFLCFEHFSYALEVIHGIEFIHSFGFLHPGLSTKKVILSPDRQCKLYDFVLKEDAPSKVGVLKTREIWTLNDLPPESLLRNEYIEKSDVWLLAVLSWSLFRYGNQPFAPFAPFDQKKSTSMDIYHHFPKKPTRFPSSLFTIFEDAWREDCFARLSVKEMRDMLLSETMCFLKDSWKDEGNNTNAQDQYMPVKGV